MTTTSTTTKFNSTIRRYLWNFSPGIQEYVEAVTFLEYMKTKRLITCEEITQNILQDKKTSFVIGLQDYLFGVADLTGELMRLCVTAAGKGKVQTCEDISQFLRAISDCKVKYSVLTISFFSNPSI